MQVLADPRENAPYQHPFLILACDGVWDVLTDDVAMTLTSGLSAAVVNLWLQHYGIKIFAIKQSDADTFSTIVEKDDLDTPEGHNADNIHNEATESPNTNGKRHLHDLTNAKQVTIQDMTKQLQQESDGGEDPAHNNAFKNQICFTCLQQFLPKPIMNQIMSYASRRLVECALSNGSTDNVTAMVIRL